MKKTITFELSGDDVRLAIGDFIDARFNVKYTLADIQFAAIIDPVDTTKLIGVAASLTAVEEEKKNATVQKRKISSNSAGSNPAGNEGTPSST